ncbi:MAG TPA: hypothetical protein PKZ76_06045 [Xanthomonadaceae bacterium]|nr:hypothetical protein [Xanthomonadaceae bacterium]
MPAVAFALIALFVWPPDAWAESQSSTSAHRVDITRYQVPHDVPQGRGANTQDLAVFAWQEFIALNWPAIDPATSGQRGRPDPQRHFSDADPGLTVWQTYRHRNEQFPANGKTDPSFDSKAPAYDYAVSITPATTDTRLDLFNNLDESSQIGLCVLCANNVPDCGRDAASDRFRFLYEAKMNRALYDYANQAGLTDSSNSFATLNAKRTKTSGDLLSYGGICSSKDADSIVMLPCGDNSVAGDAGEGAIETKAAWRRLTEQEMKSGRFYTSTVLYYEETEKGIVAHNDTFGLVALHIIHKTQSFPTFVFATWEQVDAYDGSNTSGLVFHNTGTPLPDIPVTRAHPIPADIQAITDDVHAQIDNVWKYYRLINVQAQPVDGPPPAGAPTDVLSYYYLANIAVETNQTLQNFFGKAPSGVVEPAQNVYTGGKSYQMGGCQGCHGTQGQVPGGDMSVLIATAPFNTKVPEGFNAGESSTVASARARFAASGYLRGDAARTPSDSDPQGDQP